MAMTAIRRMKRERYGRSAMPGRGGDGRQVPRLAQERPSCGGAVVDDRRDVEVWLDQPAHRHTVGQGEQEDGDVVRIGAEAEHAGVALGPEQVSEMLAHSAADLGQLN